MYYYKIIKEYSEKIINSNILKTFYEIENELDNIFIITSDPMTGMIRMKWWEEKLMDLYNNQSLDLNPTLQNVKKIFNIEQISYLVNFVQAKTYETQRYEFNSYDEIKEKYFERIGHSKSLLLFQDKNLQNLMTCLEVIKFLSLKDFYLSKNWYFSKQVIEELIKNLTINFQNIEYKMLPKPARIYYKAVMILIKNIYNNQINMELHFFRIKLSFSLLFI
jgi:hypothetical protein